MKNKITEIPSKGEISIYRTKDNKIHLEVKLGQETVWLTQQQIAQLFGTQRPAITKHVHNIFNAKELKENSVCSILEHTATDGKKYQTKFYNLDAIISVGYRVNSCRATQFRIWATDVLKRFIKHLAERIYIPASKKKQRTFFTLLSRTIHLLMAISASLLQFFYGM